MQLRQLGGIAESNGAVVHNTNSDSGVRTRRKVSKIIPTTHHDIYLALMWAIGVNMGEMSTQTLIMEWSAEVFGYYCDP